MENVIEEKHRVGENGDMVLDGSQSADEHEAVVSGERMERVGELRFVSEARDAEEVVVGELDGDRNSEKKVEVLDEEGDGKDVGQLNSDRSAKKLDMALNESEAYVNEGDWKEADLDVGRAESAIGAVADGEKEVAGKNGETYSVIESVVDGERKAAGENGQTDSVIKSVVDGEKEELAVENGEDTVIEAVVDGEKEVTGENGGTDSVIKAVVDGEKELAVEKGETDSVIEAVVDGEKEVGKESLANGEHVVIHGNAEKEEILSHESESVEKIHCEVGQQDRGVANADLAGLCNDVEVNSHSDVVNEVEESLEQDKCDNSNLGCLSRTVEDVGESRSSNGGNSRISCQPTSSATSQSQNQNIGGPSLPSRPAGLGSSASLLGPASRSGRQLRANGSAPQRQSQLSEEPAVDDVEESNETQEKLQMIRVKFLRLAHRLGQTPHNVVVAQVLYRLGLAEQLWRNTNRPGVFSFDQAKVMAEQLEAAGHDPLDFSCTIMVIGKTGVGKSATINSIFDDVIFHTDAFQSNTKKVQDIVGTVQGIRVKVIDTPGLSSCSSDRHLNEKILHSVKRFIAKSPPDIVLYFDRLDMQSRDHGDVPLLRSITDVFGPSIWFNAIVVLTHAASAPPDGPNGSPLSYEMFVTQRSHVVQQAIRQAAGDLRLMNPVSLVDNHSACRMNRAGQRVLPNGQVWKPQLLLLSFASKILAEANQLLKLQDNPPGRPSGSRAKAPPLPFLLSSLLQTRPHLRLPDELVGVDETVDDDVDVPSDSDDEVDYDELPPFKRLTKAQLEKLSRTQRKQYFEELEFREKLFFRKQLKEENKRRKLLKKMANSANEMPNESNNEIEEESSSPTSVPVPMPDVVLPTSFDSDNPTHRYRFLDSSSQWLVRPVLETQGWDHDVGYEGLNVERLFVLKDNIPVSLSGQLTKDKKECTLQMDLSTSLKHSEERRSSFGLDMQTVGKDMMYNFRAETRFNNFRRNNTTAGLTVTALGDTVSTGLKVEDKLIVNKRFRVLISGGAMTGQADVAYGGRLEATVRDKDYPIGQALSTLALSLVDWHGDLAVGCNIQSQFPIGRGSNLVAHGNISNRGSGQVGIRFNSSEQLQIALLALVPLFRNVQRLLFSSSH